MCRSCAHSASYRLQLSLENSAEYRTFHRLPRCRLVPKPFRPCLHYKISLALIATVDPKKQQLQAGWSTVFGVDVSELALAGPLGSMGPCRSDKIKEASSWPLRASIVHACARVVHHFFPNPITGFPFFIRTSRTLVCSELIRTLGTILLDGIKPATTGRTTV
jgi:hypothetical protein